MILGIGEVVLDIINIVSDFPQEGSKSDSLETVYSLGGFLPSALIFLSRLGLETALLANFGTSRFAQEMEEALLGEKVRVFPLRKGKTKIHTVVVSKEKGSRTIFKNRSRDHLISNVPSSLLEKAELILVDRHERKAFWQVMRKKKRESKIIIDTSSVVSPHTLSMVKLADFPIVPFEFLENLNPRKDISGESQILSLLIKKPLIVTLGKKGALLARGKKLEFFPSYKVKAIDVSGAGDIFRAAFSFGVVSGWQLEKSIDFANKMASLQCLKFGNSTAVPQKGEVEEFLKVENLKS